MNRKKPITKEMFDKKSNPGIKEAGITIILDAI